MEKADEDIQAEGGGDVSTLEPFDRKQTEWSGLWWHPETMSFSSTAINLANLRKFKGNVRMFVKKNKFFNGGENGRPNYLFCLRDTKSDLVNPIDVVDDESIGAKINRLKELMQEGQLNGYRAMMPSDSQAYANDLMQEAISIIEEITGEKWEFSFVTW